MDLIADHISHRFGALDVLDRVSFTVASGEVVAIVGPSGCGKSTLLSILGGLLQPSGGAAELRGAPPAGSLNPLTFVFQDFALLPWCTVEANVEFVLLHTGLSASERAAIVADALRRTDGTDVVGEVRFFEQVDQFLDLAEVHEAASLKSNRKNQPASRRTAAVIASR